MKIQSLLNKFGCFEIWPVIFWSPSGTRSYSTSWESSKMWQISSKRGCKDVLRSANLQHKLPKTQVFCKALYLERVVTYSFPSSLEQLSSLSVAVFFTFSSLQQTVLTSAHFEFVGLNRRNWTFVSQLGIGTHL